MNIISWVTGLCLLLEAPALILQAARGVTSHFNTATLFDTTLYFVMGIGAFTQAAMVAWALVLYYSRKVELPKVVVNSIRAGLALWLLGILPAVAMTVIGGHNVGIADGGAGLPLLNWSTLGGDLRIAHFLGLHAMQVLPVIGLLLHGLSKVSADRRQRLAMAVITTGYALAIVVTFAQALAGMPLIG